MESYIRTVKSIIHGNRNISDSEFNRLALELFDHQIKNNDVYRKICNSRGLTSPKHWTEIPLITTDAFKKFRLFCKQDSEIIKTFYSSGTSTGDRSKHYLSQRELKLYEVSLWASFSKAFKLENLTPNLSPKKEESNLNRFSKKIHYLVLTESPDEKPNSSLIHMFETIRKNLNVNKDCYFYKDGKLQVNKLSERLKELEKSKTRILIVGTAFSFVHFLDNCRENFNLTNTMLMETGGYKGKSREVPKEELYKKLSQKLGIQASQIISQYGMSELCTQFYDNSSFPTAPLQIGEGREHLQDAEGVRPTPRQKDIPPWSRIRILNPSNLKEEVEFGEQGLIAIYDLCNIDSCPFILTGDIGIRRDNSLELIGRSSHIAQKGCSLNY